MQQQISNALEQTKNARAKQQSWATLGYSIGQVPPGDYSFLLSGEQKLALQTMYQTLDHLITSVQQALPQAKVFVATSTSVEIDAEGMVMIELSLYGNLAAVFVYGTLLETTAQKISQCLRDNDLVQISETERDELETQGLYYHLF